MALNENKNCYSTPYYEIDEFSISDILTTSSIDDSDEPGIDGVVDGIEF